MEGETLNTAARDRRHGKYHAAGEVGLWLAAMRRNHMCGQGETKRVREAKSKTKDEKITYLE